MLGKIIETSGGTFKMSKGVKIISCVLVIILSIVLAIVPQKLSSRYQNNVTYLDEDNTISILASGLVDHHNKPHSILENLERDKLIVLLSSNCVSCIQFLPTIEMWLWVFGDNIDIYNLWVNHIPLNLTRIKGIPDEMNYSLQGINLSRSVPNVLYIQKNTNQVMRLSDSLRLDEMLNNIDAIIDGFIGYHNSRQTELSEAKICVLVLGKEEQSERLGEVKQIISRMDGITIYELGAEMKTADNYIFDSCSLVKSSLGMTEECGLVTINTETGEYKIYSGFSALDSVWTR